MNNKLINEVTLEGYISKGAYAHDKNVYFTTLKHERSFVNFKWTDNFPIYAVYPFSKQLAELAESGKEVHVLVKGVLKTRVLKTTKMVYTSILVNQITTFDDANKNTVTEKTPQK
ncbi:hypothetical protein MGM1_2060 [Candidatus Malacoplasma girerdii]|uniref:Single-stranded DNA-binding protein n=1 Tax=Candidatus Malacoplasma girerdii TaxID=1318617 RepID=A0A097SSL6_9BACT|nr:hypothetical protein MGM1_2060 [Candidatus Malacoplasma girerdii]ASJ89049.1 MAG: hypothetical protein B1217_0149 [Candidatus Malacoplasma girerdii]